MVPPPWKCLAEVHPAFLLRPLTSLNSFQSLVWRTDLISSCRPDSWYEDSCIVSSSPSSDEKSCRPSVPAPGYWTSLPAAHRAAQPKTYPSRWRSLRGSPPCWGSEGKGHEPQLGWRVLGGGCGLEESRWAERRDKKRGEEKRREEKRGEFSFSLFNIIEEDYWYHITNNTIKKIITKIAPSQLAWNLKMLQETHFLRLWADNKHSVCSLGLLCQPSHGPQLCDLPLLPHVDGHAAATMPLQELC